MEKNSEISITFVNHEIDPQEITRRLGVEPSISWNKGDARRIGSGFYKDNCWALKLDLDLDDVEGSIRKLISNIADLDELRLAAKQHEGYIGLYVYSKEAFVGYISCSILKLISDLNLGFDVSINNRY